MHIFEIFSASSNNVDYAVERINMKIQSKLDLLSAGWKVAKVDMHVNYAKAKDGGPHIVIAAVYFERY